MSRLDLAAFVNDVLQELPDIPRPVRDELAMAAVRSDSSRIEELRKALEHASEALDERAQRLGHG